MPLRNVARKATGRRGLAGHFYGLCAARVSGDKYVGGVVEAVQEDRATPPD